MLSDSWICQISALLPFVKEQLNRKRLCVEGIRHRWVNLKQEDSCTETSSLFQSRCVQNAISIHSISFAVLPSEACLTGYSSIHRPASTTKIFSDITLSLTRFVFLLPYHQFSGDQCHPFPHTHQCCVSVYHCIDREKQVAVHYFALNMIIVCEDNG